MPKKQFGLKRKITLAIIAIIFFFGSIATYITFNLTRQSLLTQALADLSVVVVPHSAPEPQQPAST